MPLQPDMAPMEWLYEPLGLIFKWSGGSNIDVGRYDPVTEERHWDQNIGVRDLETGENTLEPTYEAFKEKCAEWVSNMYDD
jgi:hypothetical protein